jgi:hypothetical protein
MHVKGRFAKGNKAARGGKGSDLSRALLKRHHVARILSESLTTKDIKDSVAAMLKIIRTASARDQISAFRALMEVAASKPNGDGTSGQGPTFNFIMPTEGVIPQNARLEVRNQAPGDSSKPLIIDANEVR